MLVLCKCVCVYTLTGLGSATLAGSEPQEPPVSASHSSSSSYRWALALTWLLPIPTQFPCLRSKHPTHRQSPWPFKVQNILSSLRSVRSLGGKILSSFPGVTFFFFSECEIHTWCIFVGIFSLVHAWNLESTSVVCVHIMSCPSPRAEQTYRCCQKDTSHDCCQGLAFPFAPPKLKWFLAVWNFTHWQSRVWLVRSHTQFSWMHS